MTIVAKCRHNTKQYCNNWDGRGDSRSLESVETKTFTGNCPPSIAKCPYKVKPAPSPKLRAK